MSIVAEKKEKQYVSDNARLIAEWNWERNVDLEPTQLTLGSHIKAWWKCKNGHEWQAIIADRNRGNKCPYCSGKRVLKGYNDLKTVKPYLIKEWNYEKNGEIKPENYTPNSHQKVWWICNAGHEWQATIAHRNSGRGCPYCSGRKILKGYNDVPTIKPSLIEEWNYEKNGDKKPENYTSNSHKKVWWICKDGHEWQASIASRNSGRGCPYCSGRYAIKEKNDLQTINLTLASEWNYEKNGELTPENVMPNSHAKVWWRCTKGHEWYATIDSRNRGSGCPICDSERKSSFPEYVLLYYFHKYGLEAIHSYREFGYELDIYIPSKKIAIEYDGYFWHKNKRKRDIEKNQKCAEDGIKLLRIREGLMSLNDSSIDYIVKKNQEDLPIILNEILGDILETKVVVDIKGDLIEIENLREHTEKSHSILYLFPKIAKDWNYEKNKNLKPENFTSNSKKTVWWQCDNGHEWQAIIANRTKGAGCPYCSGRKVLVGYNDLETLNPSLAKDWNCNKNGDLKPNNFTANSHKRVWWKCSCGHEWQASIADRNRGRGCPECAKQRRKKKDT
ncbi:MAG: hypothetical protein E7264_12120 [Lachnospiraceae bacterium]|nr:hypothetical protein [Lachnospiraceae bacterium]